MTIYDLIIKFLLLVFFVSIVSIFLSATITIGFFIVDEITKFIKKKNK